MQLALDPLVDEEGTLGHVVAHLHEVGHREVRQRVGVPLAERLVARERRFPVGRVRDELYFAMGKQG